MTPSYSLNTVNDQFFFYLDIVPQNFVYSFTIYNNIKNPRMDA